MTKNRGRASPVKNFEEIRDAHRPSKGNIERSRAARQHRLRGKDYPTCCPLVRFSFASRSLLSHSIEDAARDGPCAHGKGKEDYN